MRSRFIVSTALVLAAMTAAPALAAQPDVVAPDDTFAGKTYPEWSAAWWQWSTAQPAEHHPLSAAIDFNGTADPLANCAQSQSGPVWFLGGVVGNGGSTVQRDCAIPPGTALYFPIGNAECSSIEADPFFGATADSRGDCAVTFIEDFLKQSSLKAEVDGVSVGGLVHQRVTSPNFRFSLPRCPATNVLGVKCSRKGGESVDNGYYLLLRPLPAGPHVIHFTAAFPAFAFAVDITYRLTVG